jgi:predicted CoA-substrate-specific enzyme activase
MFYAGVDAGSRTIKVALVDAGGRVAGSGMCDQGVRQSALAKRLFDKVLSGSGARKQGIARTVATGYGRGALDWADTTVTEIACQARGVRRHAPDARTIIDIGGQDSKLIRLDPDGVVHDFAMNDRCAAGTGRFLEIVAQRLGKGLKEIGRIAEKSRRPAAISSTCVVFAESEIVGLLASEASLADLCAGVQESIAKRIGAMAGPRLEGPLVFTGGVALIPGMRGALSKALGQPVRSAENPQMTAALGAALIAAG